MDVIDLSPTPMFKFFSEDSSPIFTKRVQAGQNVKIIADKIQPLLRVTCMQFLSATFITFKDRKKPPKLTF